MAVKWVSEWYRPVRGPFFGRKKLHFWKKKCKKWPVTFTFGKRCKYRTVLNWRWWRHEEKSAQKWLFGCDSEGIRENTDWNESPLDTGLEWIQTDIICSTDPCFAPLPCTVYLVETSIRAVWNLGDVTLCQYLWKWTGIFGSHDWYMPLEGPKTDDLGNESYLKI